VIKIARGRRIEIDGIIFVAQRRLEDQRFVFELRPPASPKYFPIPHLPRSG